MEIVPAETTLEKLLFGLDTRFFVPEYQRDYSWTPAEIDQMWADIKSAHEANMEYFVGTLVLNKEEHEGGQFDIVDGQQRLATFTILFSVLRDLAITFREDSTFLEHIPRTEENKNLARKIEIYSEDRLLSRTEPDNYFLKLNKKDAPIFYASIQTPSRLKIADGDLQVHRSESRITKARKVLTRSLRDELVLKAKPLDAAYKLLVFVAKKLKFISIEVSTDYDAYLLFESLNYRGLELSTADLVKNKLLMICGDDEAKRQRTLQAWETIVSRLAESRYTNAVDFLRFFWLAFRDKRPTKRELYREIRKHINSSSFDVDRFMAELLVSVDHFVFVTEADRQWPSSDIPYGSTEQYLAELNTLRFAICVPALLVAKTMRSDELVRKLARKSLAFLFRLLTVGDYSVGLADKVFVCVVEKIRSSAPDNEVLQCFSVEEEKIGDESFQKNFLGFRSEDNSVCRYILAKLHVHNAGPEQVPKSDEVHVEHILPQNPRQWIAAGYSFGNSKPGDTIYSIGNMTLLNRKLNVAISNDVFDRKVGSYRRRESAGEEGTTFPMTFKIYEEFRAGNQTWSVERVAQRAEEWSRQAVEIWAMD